MREGMWIRGTVDRAEGGVLEVTGWPGKILKIFKNVSKVLKIMKIC